MLRWLIGIVLGEIICKSSNWQHIQRLKITILGANWQLLRLERIAKYFILSTQNIKFYWFVMKIKKFLLPIWWYNRGSFPLGNKYFGVFVLIGLSALRKDTSATTGIWTKDPLFEILRSHPHSHGNSSPQCLYFNVTFRNFRGHTRLCYNYSIF